MNIWKTWEIGLENAQKDLDRELSKDLDRELSRRRDERIKRKNDLDEDKYWLCRHLRETPAGVDDIYCLYDATTLAGGLMLKSMEDGFLFSDGDSLGLRVEIEMAINGEFYDQLTRNVLGFFSSEGDGYVPPPGKWCAFVHVVWLLFFRKGEDLGFWRDRPLDYLVKGCGLLADLIESGETAERACDEQQDASEAK